MLQIDTSNSIIIDNKPTGLSLGQRRDGSVVYTPENVATGQKYQEHAMPHARYSAAHDNPKPVHATPELAAKHQTAGRAQLEADIRVLQLEIKHEALSKKMADVAGVMSKDPSAANVAAFKAAVAAYDHLTPFVQGAKDAAVGF